MWSVLGGGCGIGLTKPYDGNPATVGNGVMAASTLEDHSKAMLAAVLDAVSPQEAKAAVMALVDPEVAEILGAA